LTLPPHPYLRIMPYPGENADIMPLQSSAGWTAAIRDGVLRVFDDTMMTHTACPWYALTDPSAPAVLRQWCTQARKENE